VAAAEMHWSWCEWSGGGGGGWKEELRLAWVSLYVDTILRAEAALPHELPIRPFLLQRGL